MLSKVFMDLEPFFEDCYRRINIREYARIMDIAPPTAAVLLYSYESENILVKERYKNYILYCANKDGNDFIALSRLYWFHKMNKLLSLMEKKLVNPTIILFGSLSKAETKKDSDIDLAVLGYKKELDLKAFEKKLKRKIQVHWFKSIRNIESRELANNIINGYVLRGRISI